MISAYVVFEILYEYGEILSVYGVFEILNEYGEILSVYGVFEILSEYGEILAVYGVFGILCEYGEIHYKCKASPLEQVYFRFFMILKEVHNMANKLKLGR